jgi:hypothetical protein
VAAYWKEHYDLRFLLETRWATLGPKVTDKLHVYVGEADGYYLDSAVHLWDDSLRKAKDPPFQGEIVFQPRAGHGFGPRPEELIQKIVAHVERTAPKGADLQSWRYPAKTP